MEPTYEPPIRAGNGHGMPGEKLRRCTMELIELG